MAARPTRVSRFRASAPERGRDQRSFGSRSVEMLQEDLSISRSERVPTREARGERVRLLLDNAGRQPRAQTARARRMFVTNSSPSLLAIACCATTRCAIATFLRVARRRSPCRACCSSPRTRPRRLGDRLGGVRPLLRLRRQQGHPQLQLLQARAQHLRLRAGAAPGTGWCRRRARARDVPRPGEQRDRARRAGAAAPAPEGHLQPGLPLARGASRPAVYACVAPDFERETNRYLHMFNPKRMDEKCYDAAEGARLWERSAALCREVGAWPW